MQAYVTLVRRELGCYLLSLNGYVIIASVLLLLGLGFVDMLVKLNGEPADAPLTEWFFRSVYFWLILLMTTPVITMRSFAQEKASGTYETLMTAPVSDLQVVLAKFTAANLFWLLLWIPLLGCLLLVRNYTSGAAPIDVGGVAGAFIGVALVGALFLSLGCCASAMSRNQVTAAMISLVAGASLFLVGVLADRIPVTADWQGRVLASLAFFEQMHDFARGVIDTRPVVLYVSLTVFFLFLTLRVMESRRWK